MNVVDVAAYECTSFVNSSGTVFDDSRCIHYSWTMTGCAKGGIDGQWISDYDGDDMFDFVPAGSLT